VTIQSLLCTIFSLSCRFGCYKFAPRLLPSWISIRSTPKTFGKDHPRKISAKFHCLICFICHNQSDDSF